MEASTTWCAAFEVPKYRETKDAFVAAKLPAGFRPVGGAAEASQYGSGRYVIACTER